MSHDFAVCELIYIYISIYIWVDIYIYTYIYIVCVTYYITGWRFTWRKPVYETKPDQWLKHRFSSWPLWHDTLISLHSQLPSFGLDWERSLPRAKSTLLCCLNITWWAMFTQLLAFTWWRHQRETFSALLALCAGNSLVTGKFPSQRPWTLSFDVFFDLHLE